MQVLRYSVSARLYHWLSAILVFGLIPVGLYLGRGDPPDGPLTDTLYLLHESFGVLLWLLVLFRLVSRQVNGVPEQPAATPPSLRLAARLNHVALYLMLLIQPVTGFWPTTPAATRWCGSTCCRSQSGRQERQTVGHVVQPARHRWPGC